MQLGYWDRVAGWRLSRRRMLAAAGGASAATVVLAACGSDGGEADRDRSSLVAETTDTFNQAKRGGVIRDRIPADPATLDVASAIAGGLNINAQNVYSTLVQFKPGYLKPSEQEVGPLLAESWEWSPDGLQITLKLRQGVKWHNKPPLDGRPLDIDDVLFSWNRFATKGGLRSSIVNAVDPAAPILSLTASDSRTIIIKLKEPLVYALDLFAPIGSFSGNIIIVPKETDSTFDIRKDMIGSGPFMLSNYTPSVGFTLRRHPEFWDKDWALADQIEFPIIPEYAAVLSQFKAGNIHYFAVRPEDILAVKREEPRLSIYVNEFSTNTTELTFGLLPTEKSPFLDERVRQALSLSWDRDLFIDTFNNVSDFRSQGLPVETRWNSVVSAKWDGWWLDPQGKDFGPNAKYYKYNVGEAKKLLAAAGYPNGLATVSSYVEGPQLHPDKRVFTVLDGMAAEAGLINKVNPVDYAKDYIPNYRDANGQFVGWAYHTVSGGQPTSLGPLSAVASTYWSKSGVTFKGFSASGKNDKSGDPQLDALLEKARVERDTEKRRALLFDIQRYLAKAMWGMILPGGATAFTMAWPALGNYRVYQGGSTIWSHYRLWLDETKPPFKTA